VPWVGERVGQALSEGRWLRGWVGPPGGRRGGQKPASAPLLLGREQRPMGEAWGELLIPSPGGQIRVVPSVGLEALS
jgi:hypothetical protein